MASGAERLIPPYDAYLRNEEWDKYIRTLSGEGMFWWFNLDIQVLRIHLAPLLDVLGPKRLPDRLRFLSRIAGHSPDPDELERYHAGFLEKGDAESAAAAATAAVICIWKRGRDFQRLTPWHKRIDVLTSGHVQVPIAAKASLMGAGYLIAFAMKGDLREAMAAGRDALLWSRRAGSNNLRVYNAMMCVYACLWNTDPLGLEPAISEAGVLCGLSEVSFIPRAVFQFIHGLHLLLFGNPCRSRQELEAIAEHEKTQGLPDHLWYLGQLNLLHAAAAENDGAWIDRVIRAIQRRGVDESRCYQAAIHHFSLGIARLAQGRTDEARGLAHRALDFGRRSGASAPEHHIRLLMAQIHSETREDDAALALLEDWKGFWEERGYHLYAVTADLEIAHIRLRRGETDRARRSYDRAARGWFPGAAPHAMNRSREFVQEIRSALVRKPEVRESHPSKDLPAIAIETFGGLRIRADGAVIEGNRWRGRKTRELLKTLIVFGGYKVSSDRIIDILWPDADGAQAAKNLKVTLSRLRRIGCEKGEQPLPWILVRHRRISLARGLCGVDAFRFRECLQRGRETDMDLESLREAIDLYKGDFLPGDQSAEWIADHRQRLQSEYVDCVELMGKRLLRMARPEEAAAVLASALEKVDIEGGLYALLMQAHLDMGRPDRAREVFSAAAERFKRELGIDPDPKLVRFARAAGIL